MLFEGSKPNPSQVIPVPGRRYRYWFTEPQSGFSTAITATMGDYTVQETREDRSPLAPARTPTMTRVRNRVYPYGYDKKSPVPLTEQIIAVCHPGLKIVVGLSVDNLRQVQFSDQLGLVPGLKYVDGTLSRIVLSVSPFGVANLPLDLLDSADNLANLYLKLGARAFFPDIPPAAPDANGYILDQLLPSLDNQVKGVLTGLHLSPDRQTDFKKRALQVAEQGLVRILKPKMGTDIRRLADLLHRFMLRDLGDQIKKGGNLEQLFQETLNSVTRAYLKRFLPSVVGFVANLSSGMSDLRINDGFKSRRDKAGDFVGLNYGEKAAKNGLEVTISSKFGVTCGNIVIPGNPDITISLSAGNRLRDDLYPLIATDSSGDWAKAFAMMPGSIRVKIG